MAPSSHRIPINQSANVTFSAGIHRLTAVIVRPAEDKEVEWVAGVTDRNNNDQWIPNVFGAE
jgi:hypothetical protein